MENDVSVLELITTNSNLPGVLLISLQVGMFVILWRVVGRMNANHSKKIAIGGISFVILVSFASSLCILNPSQQVLMGSVSLAGMLLGLLIYLSPKSIFKQQ